MAERRNVPGSRPIATPDNINVAEEYKEKYDQRYFKQLQDQNIIPKKYKDLDELADDYFDLVLNEKLSEKEAAEALGIDYKNVIGNKFLKLNVSSSGKPRAIDMRALREDIKPDERMYIEERFGKGFIEDYKRLLELEWGDKKPKKGEDVEALKARVYNAVDKSAYPSGESPFPFKSAKDEADAVRDRLRAAFGNSGKASEVHRGHGFSAVEGAGTSKPNVLPELGLLNVSHGAAPRFDPEVMRILNMSDGDLQGLYDGYLRYKGLDIDEARYYGTLLAADEGLRQLKEGISVYNPKASTPEGSPDVPQESIEWRNRRLNEIEQQVRFGLEKSGMDPQGAAIEARNRIQEMSYQQSYLFDTTKSTALGPGTVTQTKIPYTVTTPATTKIDEFGREKKVKPQTRTEYQDITPRIQQLPTEPMPSMVQPTPAPTTPKKQAQQEIIKVIPRGVQQKGGKVSYTRARRATKLLPLVPLGLAAVEVATKGAQAAQAFMQGDEAKASQLGGEAALAAAEGIVGEIPVVGDILIADPAADTTLEGAARTQQQIQAKRQQQQQRRQADVEAYQKAMKPKPQPKPKPTRDKAAEARQRGGKMTIGPVTLPELGISEMLGIN